MKTLKIYSLSNFQRCNAVLLTRVPTCCSSLLMTYLFYNWNWYLLPPFAHFAHPLLLRSPLTFGKTKRVSSVAVAFSGSEPHPGVPVPPGSIPHHEVHRPHDGCRPLRDHASRPAHHHQPVSAQCPVGVELGRSQFAPHVSFASSEQIGHPLPFQLHQRRGRG